MVLIYILKTYNIGSNSHITARDSEWVFECVADIDSIEVETFVIENSYKHTDLPIFKRQMIEAGESESNIADFVHKFCFDDAIYLKYKRFYVGKPNKKLISKIIDSLKESGINVKIVKSS